MNLNQPVFVGIGAGVAAALLYLAPIGGSALAFPLFMLTGLPLAIAGFGWGVVAGLSAAVAGALVVVAVLGVIAALVFIALFAAPIAWLTRLAGMSRSADPDDPASNAEWFPLGRLLLHTALAVAIGLVAVGFVTGYDPAIVATEASRALLDFMGEAPMGEPQPTPESIAPFVDLYVAILPFTLAMFMVAVLVFNLWLGALTARKSGRMVRPAERLWTIVAPNELMIGFGVAAALALLLSGPLGEVAAVVAGAFGCALALVGLAVLHALTVGMAGRGIILGVSYALIFFSGLPLVLFAALGAAENFLQLRARRFGGAPPQT
jgi:hypothetical protein